MVAPDVRSLVLILAASAVAAFLARLHHRLLLPTVVVEIVLGILIGPEALGLADSDPYIEFLSNFGLVFLFFFAGLEVVEKRVPRRALGLGTAGWAMSLAIGLAAGTILEKSGVDAEGWILGVALATTALGTLVPILSDAGLLKTPLGTAVLGNGVAGEFWPIVVISVFLTGVYGSVAEVLLLVGFGLLVALAGWTALRARPPGVVRVLQETVHTTGQAAVRLSIVILAALVLLARDVGFDFVLGAFAAGLVVGLVLDTPDGEVVRMRLEGIGFGFLIPIYFVTTGLDFDVDSLLTAKGLALGGSVPRPAVRDPWLRGAAVAAGVRCAQDALPGALRRNGAAVDRGDRGHRHRPGRNRSRRRCVAHRGRDDLRPRLPVPRDAPRRRARGHERDSVAGSRRQRVLDARPKSAPTRRWADRPGTGWIGA